MVAAKTTAWTTLVVRENTSGPDGVVSVCLGSGCGCGFDEVFGQKELFSSPNGYDTAFGRTLESIHNSCSTKRFREVVVSRSRWHEFRRDDFAVDLQLLAGFVGLVKVGGIGDTVAADYVLILAVKPENASVFGAHVAGGVRNVAIFVEI